MTAAHDVVADLDRYAVVRNDEEQYSIWAQGRPVPAGWHEVGVEGTKEECLAHIERVWTDLRPRSVREHMARLAEAPPPVDTEPVDEGPDLPTRLRVEQPVRVVCRPDTTAAAFQAALEAGYVHVLFTETVGGTELGVAVDTEASDWSRADFAGGSGTVRVVGTLVLDFQAVRCVARIDLADLSGRGHVEPVEP